MATVCMMGFMAFTEPAARTTLLNRRSGKWAAEGTASPCLLLLRILLFNLLMFFLDYAFIYIERAVLFYISQEHSESKLMHVCQQLWQKGLQKMPGASFCSLSSSPVLYRMTLYRVLLWLIKDKPQALLIKWKIQLSFVKVKDPLLLH